VSASAVARLVAVRELRLLLRRRALRGTLALLAAAAWLPPLLLPLRAGTLGLASFDEVALPAVVLGAVILPLLSLLVGTDMLAGEIEDGTLIGVVTLPLSRAACFAGKYVARLGFVTAGYAAAFASAALAIVLARGSDGWSDYAGVASAGLPMCVACVGLGVALGASARGRVRALGAALVAWVLIVFVVDAALLATIVALAPAPPAQVGVHGHSELVAPARALPIFDPHAQRSEAGPPDGGGSRAAWLMVADPVDLFRLTALMASPHLGARLLAALGPGGTAAAASPLTVGWLLWLVLPPLVGARRFRCAVIR
jgi:Cu-processing system permease protein